MSRAHDREIRDHAWCALETMALMYPTDRITAEHVTNMLLDFIVDHDDGTGVFSPGFVANASHARILELIDGRPTVECEHCGTTIDDDPRWSACCPDCGISHGDPCHECGRRGVHTDDCTESDNPPQKSDVGLMPISNPVRRTL